MARVLGEDVMESGPELGGLVSLHALHHRTVLPLEITQFLNVYVLSLQNKSLAT